MARILARRTCQPSGFAMLWPQIAVVFLLILLNGFFAMAEMAVVSARKARLQHAAALGRDGARAGVQLVCRRCIPAPGGGRGRVPGGGVAGVGRRAPGRGALAGGGGGWGGGVVRRGPPRRRRGDAPAPGGRRGAFPRRRGGNPPQ